MALIHWSPLLSIGIDSIDKQHQQLIEIINNLNDAMEKGHAEAVLSKIFDDLTSYTMSHFGYEEMLFEKYGYDAAQHHFNEHQELIQQIENLKEKKNIMN